MIYWAGVSSDDVRVVVEHYPQVTLPSRKTETKSVPGRNGDLLFVEDAFSNVVQPYDVYISAEAMRIPSAARAVAAWLYAPAGYQRLEDSYDLDHFRIAYYNGPTDIENILNRFGRATISFNCKPQRFLKLGEHAVSFNSPAVLRSPSRFPAIPMIRVYGSGAGSLFVGEYTVTFSSIDGYVDLDCETQNAYKGVANKNASVSFSPDCPRLIAGENQISWSGGITSVQITPRWWTL